MGVFSTYSEAVRLQYHSPTFSRATFFNIFVFMLGVGSPYLIAYRTGGFWKKLDLVREQPIVHFKHQLLLIMDVAEEGSPRKMLMWSTFKSLNNLLNTPVTPFIMSREGDLNLDGIKEYLELQLTVPIKQKTIVNGLHLFLLFDFKLLKHATLQMEGMGYTNYNFGRVGNRYNLYSDLGLTYRTPLWSRFRDERYNIPVIPRGDAKIRAYDPRTILQQYSLRNVTTILSNKYEFMEEDPAIPENEFLIHLRINYSEVSYECWAGLGNLLKWVWIQYLAIFVMVFIVLKKFQKLVYESKMFDTRTEVPWEKGNNNQFQSIISHCHQ